MLAEPQALSAPIPARPFDSFPTHALMRVAQRPPRVFTHGQGSWLFDSEGRRYLDLVQGWAVNALGHAPPEIAAALQAQAGRLLQAGPGLYNDRAVALADRLARLSGLERCFITSSGAEANEGAIKLARKYGQVHKGGAFEIITFFDSFHGRTLATMSASGKPGFDTLFAPQVPGFPKARLNDLDSVQALIGPNTVAVMLEPIQGEAGVIEADDHFLRSLRRLCDAHGLLLILDEVQTGVGRTGELWGHVASGIQPDVMTLGKGLGGGVPIGAVLAREPVCCFAPGDQGGTYNGNPLACAAALAVLERITGPGFLADVRTRGAALRAGLQQRAVCLHPHGKQDGRPTSVSAVHVRGRGLLQAVQLPGDTMATRLAQAGLDLSGPDSTRPGLLLNAVRPSCLRFIPALTLSAAELAQAFDLIDRLIKADLAAMEGSGGHS